MFAHNTKYRDVVILNNVKDLAKSPTKSQRGILRFAQKRRSLAARERQILK